MSWSVEAAADIPGALIELRRYDLPRPSEMHELDDSPVFSVVLPRPEGTRGEVHFDGAPTPHKVGMLLLRPAGIGMYSRGDGGILNILACRLDSHLFSRTTGLRDWDAERLRRCAALNSRQILQTAQRLHAETVNPGFAAGIVQEALVQLLLADIARQFRTPPRTPHSAGGLAPWQLARIDEMLQAAHGAWPSTAELARQCGLSRSHLSRAFSSSTHMTLTEYAAMLRVERAKEMMRGNALAVADIAHRLGFATPSAFTAAFRRATGHTPRRFAATLRGLQE